MSKEDQQLQLVRKCIEKNSLELKAALAASAARELQDAWSCSDEQEEVRRQKLTKAFTLVHELYAMLRPYDPYLNRPL